ncbi:hypothetical protein BKH46_09155 [Helicobacter sp. 12S02634-8]|nr:hypothetical protein BKH46_09155 [Helicobacter sp. 12S02634-8]
MVQLLSPKEGAACTTSPVKGNKKAARTKENSGVKGFFRTLALLFEVFEDLVALVLGVLAFKDLLLGGGPL